MSPEFLEVLYERDTCDPSDLPKWDALFQRLEEDILLAHPRVEREHFRAAIQFRYREFLHQVILVFSCAARSHGTIQMRDLNGFRLNNEH